LETKGNTRLIVVTNVKMTNVLTTIIVGDKILIQKDGILRKAESIWKKNNGP
jgi:hypothetical protein